MFATRVLTRKVCKNYMGEQDSAVQ